MGEVKSTLDLVMEKTKHLKLSETEKEEQKADEVNKKLKGLVQKYLDNILKKEDMDVEVESLRKTHGSMTNKILLTELSGRLDLDQDNGQILILLAALCGIDVSGLAAVFKEYQDAIRTAAQKKMKEIKENLVENRFISGSAVVPNLEADTEWIREKKRVKSKFSEFFSREKSGFVSIQK